MHTPPLAAIHNEKLSTPHTHFMLNFLWKRSLHLKNEMPEKIKKLLYTLKYLK